MLAYAAASFLVCVLALLALRPLAIAVDLIDRPGGHKTHHGDVPIVGGLAMFIGVTFGVGLVPLLGNASAAYLAGCALLVTIGLFDDRFTLSPWARLAGQITAAVLLVAGSGSVVTTLGDPFGTGSINLAGYTSIAFTVLIIVAAINAFNMVDGMDGLAGSVALVSLLVVAYLAWMAGLRIPAAVSLVMVGAVSAFLVFNLPFPYNRPLRCFMGDAGSTVLGLSVAWLCLEISEGPRRAVSPVTTLWIVALPLYELVWSTARRIIGGVSPFRADRAHFHHLLLKAGFGVRGAFVMFATLAIFFAAIGLIFNRYHVPDRYSFLLLVALGAVTIRLMYRAELVWGLARALRRPRAQVTASLTAASNLIVREVIEPMSAMDESPRSPPPAALGRSVRADSGLRDSH